MNYRESPHHPVRRREALRCLALMLLAPTGAAALPRQGGTKSQAPNRANPTCYLPALGAPQLRFQSKPVDPEPVSNAAPTAAASATSTTPADDFIIPKLFRASDQVTETLPADTGDKTNAAKPKAAAKPQPAIIPDETRPALRAEDFLPYFQMPGSARTPNDVNLFMPVPASAPAPAAVPPSSATYTQTPK